MVNTSDLGSDAFKLEGSNPSTPKEILTGCDAVV